MTRKALAGAAAHWYSEASVLEIEEVAPVNELTMVLPTGVTVGR